MNHAELAQALRDAAYLEGEFTLRSGRKSNYYLDKYLFETKPELLRELANHFAPHVTDNVDRIAGAELGGIPLAAATSLATNKPFIIVRNSKKADYGTGKLIEGQLNAGDRVLLVEDICTSGGQAVEALNTIKAAGGNVVGAVVVIDRQEGGRENIERAGYPCQALFTSADLGIGK